MTKPIVLVIGTRPEGIKVLPVYFALKRAGIPVLICSTTQHEALLSEVYTVFGVKPDVELNIMRPGQDLFHITQQVLEKTKQVFSSVSPALIIVQGDTTTAMASALSAFYLDIPVAHIEAGLRTSTIKNPFPEELNRRIISLIASVHFAPTAMAVGNLLSERVSRNSVFYTGNTVVDALRIMRERIEHNQVTLDATLCNTIADCHSFGKQIVLLTAHRRESFNGGIDAILRAVKEVAQQRDDIFFIYPYHPNPYVKAAIERAQIHVCANMFLSEPLSYQDMVYALVHADWVATDSGGICEEAVSLGKRVLILRTETERLEGVWAGLAQLVGTETAGIKKAMLHLADTIDAKNIQHESIFGDGYAAEKMVHIMQQLQYVHELKNFSLYENAIKKELSHE